MVGGSRDQDLRSALDEALREMMGAASELPLSDSLRAFIENLDDKDETPPDAP